MRLFRRRPTWKTVEKLERELCWKDEAIDGWRDRYAHLELESFGNREEARRYRTEARQLRQTLSNFVWKSALARFPEAAVLDTYLVDVADATSRLINELTAGRNTD